jgi:hypothetical protein
MKAVQLEPVHRVCVTLISLESVKKHLRNRNGGLSKLAKEATFLASSVLCILLPRTIIKRLSVEDPSQAYM